MGRTRLKCRYGCGYRNDTGEQANLGRHEARCINNPDRVRNRSKEEIAEVAEANGAHAHGLPSVAQVRQEIAMERATIVVLTAKYPKGIKPDEYGQVVALVKAVERA